MAVSVGTYASKSGSPSAGDIHLPTDSYWDYLVAAGSDWLHLFAGRQYLPPVDTGFSWVNQGDATVSQSAGALVLHAPLGGSGANRRIRTFAAPAPPYKLRAVLLVTGGFPVFSGGAVCFRESSSGKGSDLGCDHLGNFSLNNWTSATAPNTGKLFSGFDAFVRNGPPWFQIEDDGVSLRYSVSAWGGDFVTLLTESRTSFMAGGPNQVAFYADPEDTARGVTVSLLHWQFIFPAAPARHFIFARMPRLRSGR